MLKLPSGLFSGLTLLLAILPGVLWASTFASFCDNRDQCDDSLRRAARRQWSARPDYSSGAPEALTKFRVCESAEACFRSRCTSVHPGLSEYSNKWSPEQRAQLKRASEPYVMPAKLPASGRALGTVVLVHGLADSPYIFANMAESLSSRGFNVVVPLLSGHGADAHANLKADNLRRDFSSAVAFAKTVFGKDKVSVGCFSTGCTVVSSVLKSDEQLASQVKKRVMFDPLAKLGAMEISWLSGYDFCAWRLTRTLRNNVTQPVLDSFSERRVAPAKDPVHLLEHMDAACDVLNEIRRSGKTENLSQPIPTQMYLSNTNSDNPALHPIPRVPVVNVPMSIVDREGALTFYPQAEVFDVNKSFGAVPVNQEANHTGLLYRAHQTNCLNGSAQTKVNPKFDAMADSVRRFLSSVGNGDRSEVRKTSK